MCLLNSHERSPFVLPVAAEQWSCLGDGISLPGQSPGQDATQGRGGNPEERLNLQVRQVRTRRVTLNLGLKLLTAHLTKLETLTQLESQRSLESVLW